jgi:hypothetical protein
MDLGGPSRRNCVPWLTGCGEESHAGKDLAWLLQQKRGRTLMKVFLPPNPLTFQRDPVMMLNRIRFQGMIAGSASRDDHSTSHRIN